MAKISEGELDEKVSEVLEEVVCDHCQEQFKKIAKDHGETLADTMAEGIRLLITSNHVYSHLKSIGFEFPTSYADEEDPVRH